MTRLMTTCAMTLALTLPAAAQTASDGASTDVTAQSTIRYISRDSDGNIVFDSMAADRAPGATSEALAAEIAEADGPTTAETDDMEVREVAGDGSASGQADGGMPTETAEAMTETGAGGAADSFTAEMAAQAVPDTETLEAEMAEMGDASGGMESGGGVESVPFDMEAFASEMFEQGYRKGYVRAMSEVRAEGMRRMQQRIDAGQFQNRERFRQQAEDTRRGMTRDVLTFRDAQGNRMRFVLPEGMSRAEFLRQIDR